MRITKIFFLLAIFAMMVTSCSKENVDNINADTNTSFVNGIAKEAPGRGSASTRDLDFPTVDGDRYVFRDSDHLTAYYQGLNAILDRDFNEFDEVVTENEGINSVHTKLMNDEGFTRVEDKYMPFLTDPIMRSIVNENFEFQVADVLITYMNNREILRSDPTDNSVRDAIRAMPKGEKLDVESIPSGAHWADDTKIESFKASWCGCSINIEVYSCDTVRVYGSCHDLLFGDSGGDLEIYLNSVNLQNVDPYIEMHVENNYEIFIVVTDDLIEEYGSTLDNILWIFGDIEGDCFFNTTTQDDFIYQPGIYQCDDGERFNWGFEFDGKHLIYYLTSNYHSFWGQKESAEMVSLKSSGGIFVLDKFNDLNLKISADRRGLVFCGVDSEEEDPASCSNCYHLREEIAPFWGRSYSHCTGDVIGTYRKSDNGTTLLTATGVPEYECCD